MDLVVGKVGKEQRVYRRAVERGHVRRFGGAIIRCHLAIATTIKPQAFPFQEADRPLVIKASGICGRFGAQGPF